MIDLRPNCVAQFKMNDKAANPWVAGLNGVPTELVKNGKFDSAAYWDFSGTAEWYETRHSVRFTGPGGLARQATFPTEIGKKYLIVFNWYQGAGAIRIYIGNQHETVTNYGTHTVMVECASNPELGLSFYAIIVSTNLYIDNVSAICLDDFPLTGGFNDFTNVHSVAGKINRALSFDGSNYIEVFDNGALSFNSGSQDFSIAIWLRKAGTGMKYIIDKRDGVADGWVLNTFIGEKPVFKLNAIVILSDTGIPNDNDWHLLIVTVNRSGTAYMYLDNVQVAGPVAISGEVMDITNNLFIGQQYDGDYKYEGDIDVITFFDKVLSEAERDMLWHGRKGTERLISLHHHIYRGQDGNIDYSSPAAEMARDDSQVTIIDQALPANTIWHYIRRQIDDECGLESDDSPACIVAIDSNGDMIGSTPNPPISLIIERLSNGRFRLRWRYTKLSEEVTPTGFKIYTDSGSGFNFTSPDATIAYGIGGINNEFSWISGALTHGQIYRFCVRSYRTGEGESQNTDYAAADADSEGPAAITGLQASYEEI